MTLLGYGLMAQKHMQTYLPRMYSGIADPETYFSELDERVMDLVEETTRDLLVGVTLGLVAGYFRGWVDAFIMRIMDIILAFPSLLLALVLVAILGPGLFNAMIAIAVVLQPHFARLTRAAVMNEKNREYVTSARLAGASSVLIAS